MRWQALICAVVLATGCADLTAQEAGVVPPPGTLIVVNRDGGSIAFIDLPSGIEMARHPVGPRIPHEMAISPNGRIALSSEYGTAENPGSKVLVFDVPSARLMGEIELGPQTRPHSLAFLPDGRRAVVSMEQADEIALIDVFDRRIVDTFAVGGEDNHMVRVSPDGRMAYVAGRGAAGTLSIVDLAGGSDTVVIETGEGAEGLAVSPDGSEVWVANRIANSISVVDTRRQRVAATIEDAGAARRVEISAAGRVLVPASGAPGLPQAQVLALYDVSSDRFVAREVVHESGGGGFAIHIADEAAFVADRGTNQVLFFDLNDFAGPTVIVEGLDDPDGLVFSPLRLNVLNE